MHGAEDAVDCKEAMTVAENPRTPSGKSIRLTEYAACAG
jgi:hypothetical protein